MKNRLHRYDVNKHRPRHGYRYTKYKMCLSIMMVIYITQHLRNIWGSVHEKVKHRLKSQATLSSSKKFLYCLKKALL